MSQKSIRVREVFFDFEGTLVDFQWQLRPAVEECLSALVNAGFQREWYGSDPSYSHLYNHTLHLIQRGLTLGGDPSVAATIDTLYDQYDADALTRWTLYPETLEVFETLRRQGFRMGIISNIGKITLRTAMHKLDLSDRVGVVISRNDVKRLKPDPEGLIKAADTLQVNPAQSVFVGDSRNDVQAARAAGMLAGYIRGGEDSPEAMNQVPADIEIDSLGQLPPLLFRIVP
jgi:phosphoglycolate phosphatase